MSVWHPKALLRVCVRGGGGMGVGGRPAGSWPESRLQSESPGIPKSSLVAPQCHIRLPPPKSGISDSSSPSPTPPRSCQFLAKIRFHSNLWLLRFMCYFSLANDSLFRVRRRRPLAEGPQEGFSRRLNVLYNRKCCDFGVRESGRG